jgi:hypothetical protein
MLNIMTNNPLTSSYNTSEERFFDHKIMNYLNKIIVFQIKLFIYSFPINHLKIIIHIEESFIWYSPK